MLGLFRLENVRFVDFYFVFFGCYLYFIGGFKSRVDVMVVVEKLEEWEWVLSIFFVLC